MFRVIKDQDQIDPAESFKAMIKTYTSEAVYRQITGALVNGNY